MWMEYSYLCGEYFAYVAIILFKDFVLLTKIQVTVQKFIIDTFVLTL
jgi:hypothetical protein